jgi:hypothetical protein
MTKQRILKAGGVGLVGALLMFILMQIAITTGMAPFQMPPSAAFLKALGLPPKPLALIVHFLYGAFWSIVAVLLFKEKTNLVKGLAIAGGLWLIMMLILSPIIGWGILGTADTADLPAKLQLGATPKYVLATLVLHLIYGLTIGWGNQLWLQRESGSAAGAYSSSGA